MTQSDADLIYEYLHERYRYEDGYFINLANNKKLDGFCAQSGRMRVTLHINKKDYYVRYSSLIWIYHHKVIFYSFDYKDGNTVNNKIENLVPLNTVNHSFIKRKKSKGYREITLKNGTSKYRAEAFMGGKSHNFGTYNNKEDAKRVYYEAKKLWVSNQINPKEIKQILIDKNIIPKKQPKPIKEPIKRKGYFFDKRDKKFYAFYYVNKKRIGLGSYKSAQEAHEAYLKAKKEMATT
jgi:hypothetical protein